MLKLTIKPGEFINIGDDVRVIYSGGSEGNIHLLIDAPRELNIVRSKVLARNSANNSDSDKKTSRFISPYYISFIRGTDSPLTNILFTRRYVLW